MRGYYNVIDYIAHTVHFIPMTHLVCNWKLIPLNLSHLFFSLSHFFPLCQPPVCPLYLGLCFCLVMFVHLFFRFHIQVKSQSICLWLIPLNIIASRSIGVVTNDNISLFLWLSSIPLALYIYATSLSIDLLVDTDCFRILAIVDNASMNVRMHIFF